MSNITQLKNQFKKERKKCHFSGPTPDTGDGAQQSVLEQAFQVILTYAKV